MGMVQQPGTVSLPGDQDDPFEKGLARLHSKFGDRVPQYVDRFRIRTLATEAVEGWPEALSSDYQALLIEALTVAVVAREINNEHPLALADVRAFIGWSAAFFNSFVHP